MSGILTSEKLEEFKVIYKKQFGTELSEEEALELALRLLNLTRSVLFPNIETIGTK